MPRRLTLGFFLDFLDDGYQMDVLSGVEQFARSEELNLLVLAGGILGLESSRGPRNFLFEMIEPAALDAALLLSGTLSNRGGIPALESFRRRFVGKPVCSIGTPLSGAASVLSNNAFGMREALVHLIETHGHRRIAFLRGPEANVEADERYRVYLALCEEYDLEVSARFAAPADFCVSDGWEGINLLLERGARFDAVACASDSLAVGALNALCARGIEVPKHVAVIGFDDVRAARFARVPLSTVRQPLAEQGRLASEILYKILRGMPVSQTVSLPTTFVTRKSCGCPAFRRGARRPAQSAEQASFDAALRARYGQIVARLEQLGSEAAAHLERGWPARLLDGLAAEVQGNRADTFNTALEALLDRSAGAGADMAAWHAVIASLRSELAAAVSCAELQRFCEELLEQAHVLVGMAAERVQAQARLLDAEATQRLYRCADRLMRAGTVDTVFSELTSQLQQLEVASCCVALCDGSGNDVERRGKLCLAWDAQAGRIEKLEGAPFETARLFAGWPSQRDRVLMALPLSLGQHELGALFVEKGPATRNLFEPLAAHVSYALARFASRS